MHSVWCKCIKQCTVHVQITLYLYAELHIAKAVYAVSALTTAHNTCIVPCRCIQRCIILVHWWVHLQGTLQEHPLGHGFFRGILQFRTLAQLVHIWTKLHAHYVRSTSKKLTEVQKAVQCAPGLNFVTQFMCTLHSHFAHYARLQHMPLQC